MRVLLLIIFILIKLHANTVYAITKGSVYLYVFTEPALDTFKCIVASTNNGNSWSKDKQTWYKYTYYTVRFADDINLDCIYNNKGEVYLYHQYCDSSCSCRVDETYYKIDTDVIEFCKQKEGCEYSKIANMWVCPDYNICLPGLYYDDNTNKCEESKCPDNFKVQECPDSFMIKDYKDCVCKCIYPLTDDVLGHCIPNPNIDEEKCEKEGYEYVDASSWEVFTSIEKAVASLYGTGCYTKEWIDAKIEALQAKFSPENVIKSAIGFLPFTKLLKIPKWLGLVENVEKTLTEPKLLENNKPIIDMRFNPETGAFEPAVSLEARQEVLDPKRIFNNPATAEEAQDILKPTQELDDFLRSKFVEAGEQDEVSLPQTVTAYSIEKEPLNTKVIDDLRSLFEKSTIEETTTSFPAVIENKASATGELVPVTVERTAVKPIQKTDTNEIYEVNYAIQPENSPEPLKVTYTVVKDLTSPEPIVSAQPVYNIQDSTNTVTTVEGDKITNIYNITTINNPETSTNTETETETETETPPDFTQFETSAETEITKALTFKTDLFTCPAVEPDCPNYLEIEIQGHTFKINDLTCEVIDVINNPDVSPAIDKVGLLIVMYATILGFLSLFRRD